MPQFDLVIENGHLIDPANGRDGVRDIAFAAGKVAAVDAHIPPESARTAYDAGGAYVTPGLVDIHTHFYYGVISLSLDSRTEFLPIGVTTAVDAGTAGASNYYNLRDLIIRPSALHLYAFLNIAALGLTGGRYVHTSPLEMASVENTARIIQRNLDTIVGVKLLLPSEGSPNEPDSLALLDRAVQAAAQSGTIVLLHVDGGAPLSTVVERLRPGDVITHAYHGRQPNIIGPDGKVRPEIREAAARGILFDISPAGHHHCSWHALERAAAEGFWPQVIATDHANPARGAPMYDILDCMAIMLSLGMPLAEVVRASTETPARAIGKTGVHGSLSVGAEGDAAIFEEVSEAFAVQMMDGQRTLQKRLRPRATVRAGTLWSPRPSAASREVMTV